MPDVTPRPKQPKKAKRREPMPDTVVAEVRARSGGWCEFPGCDLPYHDLHHKRRRSRGGAHVALNIAALCRDHHGWVHAHPAEAHDLGLLLREGDGMWIFSGSGAGHAPSSPGAAPGTPPVEPPAPAGMRPAGANFYRGGRAV